jgi:hypothetical protein
MKNYLLTLGLVVFTINLHSQNIKWFQTTFNILKNPTRKLEPGFDVIGYSDKHLVMYHHLNPSEDQIPHVRYLN